MASACRESGGGSDRRAAAVRPDPIRSHMSSDFAVTPVRPNSFADLAAAEKLLPDRLAGTFNTLVRLFTLSTEFDTALAPSTKTEYRRMLTKEPRSIRRHADGSAR